MATQAIWNAFFVLWVWPSHFGLPLLVATVLFARPRVERHPAFVNMCITEIIAGVFMSILLYANRFTYNGPEPSLALCQFQASLLAGANTMTSFSLLGLVLQVYHSIRSAYDTKLVQDPIQARRRTLLLLILPYTVWLVCAFTTALYTNGHTTVVKRGVMPYCSAGAGPIQSTIAAIDTVVLLGTLVLEVMSLTAFVRLWQSAGHRDTLLDLSVRIIAFALLISVALALAAASIFMPSSPVPDLVMATMGTFILFIFGTQRDILRAWAHALRLPTHWVSDYRVSVVASQPSPAQFSTFATATSFPPSPRAESIADTIIPERKDSLVSDLEHGMPMTVERSEKDAVLGTPIAWSTPENMVALTNNTSQK